MQPLFRSIIQYLTSEPAFFKFNAQGKSDLFFFLYPTISDSAGKVMNDRERILLNIVIGIVGAFFGSFLFNLCSVSAARTLIAMIQPRLVGCVVSCILLGIINPVRRGSVGT
jgi:uncharacterized membrane protein YeaQ/YmgE (transglycosylase-associated protein family)